jgi:hypothetical protein
MILRRAGLVATLLGLLLAAPALVRADESESPPLDDLALGDSTATATAPAPAPKAAASLEALVPSIARDAYHLAPGVRPYRNRLAFSPGFGTFGDQRLFSFRLAFSPSEWLTYEGALEHNPAQSVHAVLHSFTAIVRHPFAGRFQPYLSLGYGMFMVFPGRSLNADPVTKNAITTGGGLECFLRDDLALRGDVRHASVFAREKDRDGVVVFDYLESTIGLVFYRSLVP